MFYIVSAKIREKYPVNLCEIHAANKKLFSPQIVNMLLFLDNFVKLILLLALFLVYVQLSRSLISLLAPHVMLVDPAVDKIRMGFYKFNLEIILFGHE